MDLSIKVQLSFKMECLAGNGVKKKLAWQRGSNENGNGFLREFYPKGTDFTQVEDEDLAHSLDLINHRPR